MQLANISIKSVTRNLGAGGAFIDRDQTSEPGEIFAMTIEPPNRAPIETTVEVLWTGMVIQLGMGVRFIKISDQDRYYISQAVAEYLGKESND